MGEMFNPNRSKRSNCIRKRSDKVKKKKKKTEIQKVLGYLKKKVIY